MLRKIIFLLSLFIFLTTALFAESSSLIVSVPKAPIPVLSSNKRFLVYELQLFNPSDKLIRIGRLEIFDEYNEKQATYMGTKLTRNSLIYKGDKFLETNKSIELDKASTAFIFIWIPIEKSADVPEKLSHNIWTVELNKDKSTPQVKLLSYDILVSTDKPLLISPPLKGNGWVAGGAPAVNSYHRKALLHIDGKFYLAERYAVDWIQMCSDGSTVQGDIKDNNNWPAFGHEVMAVADGEISKVHIGVLENTPPQFPEKMPLADAAGNHVIEKIHQDGKDYYVLYSHMQPGFLRVKAGDKVKQGQVIGLLGNTGNSSMPHLHLQISDANDPLKAEGIPFVFKSAALEGRAQEIDRDLAIWKPLALTKIPVKGIMPTLNEVYYFSDGATHCKNG